MATRIVRPGRVALAGLALALVWSCSSVDEPATPEGSPPRAPNVSPPRGSVDVSGSAAAVQGSSPSPSAAPPASSAQEQEPPEAVAAGAPIYPSDRSHSPIDAVIAARLRALAASKSGLDDNVFAKVGDSITVSDDFLKCVPGKRLALAAHEAALRPVIDRFLKGNGGGTDPFRRLSLASKIGWSAWQVLAGSKPPLLREHRAVNPAFAFVMFGTNDIEMRVPHHYADKLFDAVEWLVKRGTIPILFTIPARGDRADADKMVPRYNEIIRGTAEALSIPLVDYHLRMAALPRRGLGPDRIHPSTYVSPKGRAACDFSPSGLEHGYNLRNLLALEALHRVTRSLAAGQAPLDSPSSTAARGDWKKPLIVDKLPYSVWLPAPRDPGSRSSYGCQGEKKAPGAELVLQLTSDKARALRVEGFDRGVAADLYVLGADDRCRARGERKITTKVPAGTVRIVLDQVKKPGTSSVAGTILTLREIK